MLFSFCVASSLHYEALHVRSCQALCLCVSSVLLAFWSPCLGNKELVFVLIVHLYVNCAHVNLCHFFSSSWCQGLAATSACGSSWTFLFTFCSNSIYLWSVRVAERLALPTSVHGVAGSNPARGEILPEPKRRFIAQSLSWSRPFIVSKWLKYCWRDVKL